MAKTSSADTRDLFYPKDNSFFNLYVLKLEPQGSEWHGSDMRRAGVCRPAMISLPAGPKSPQSHPAGVCNAPIGEYFFLFGL